MSNMLTRDMSNRSDRNEICNIDGKYPCPLIGVAQNLLKDNYQNKDKNSKDRF